MSVIATDSVSLWKRWALPATTFELAMPRAQTKRALIVARTYPVPTEGSVESSCTAAITAAGEWLRLFPVPWRILPTDQRFRKYQWIEARVQKAAGDPRPESYRLTQDGISILSQPLSSKTGWRAKKEIIFPLRARGLCRLQTERDRHQAPTLGVFRPAEILRLRVAPDRSEWSQGELALLRQNHLFVEPPARELEKIPYHFIYQFRCEEPDCRGHNLMCTDWEMAESYRSWRIRYGDKWEAKFPQRYETDMIEKYETHFFVGTVASHPASWIIIGLFYPPKEAASNQRSLFPIPQEHP